MADMRYNRPVRQMRRELIAMLVRKNKSIKEIQAELARHHIEASAPTVRDDIFIMMPRQAKYKRYRTKTKIVKPPPLIYSDADDLLRQILEADDGILTMRTHFPRQNKISALAAIKWRLLSELWRKFPTLSGQKRVEIRQQLQARSIFLPGEQV